MTASSSTPPEAPRELESSPWVHELSETLLQRRELAVRVALGVAIVGVLLAVVGILPATPLVGFAVGVGACIAALATVLAVDTGEITVHNARHVRSSGSTVRASVVRDSGREQCTELAHTFATGQRLIIGVTVPSRAQDDSSAVALGLASTFARDGQRTLLMDLVDTTRVSVDGASEVAAGTARFATTVEFDADLSLARISAGRRPELALSGLKGLVERLPSDIETLIVALPGLQSPAVIEACGALGNLLVLVDAGRTTRVDLIATLNAADATGVTCEVVLVEDVTAAPAVAVRTAEVAPDLERPRPLGTRAREVWAGDATPEDEVAAPMSAAPAVGGGHVEVRQPRRRPADPESVTTPDLDEAPTAPTAAASGSDDASSDDAVVSERPVRLRDAISKTLTAKATEARDFARARAEASRAEEPEPDVATVDVTDQPVAAGTPAGNGSTSVRSQSAKESVRGAAERLAPAATARRANAARDPRDGGPAAAVPFIELGDADLTRELQTPDEG